MISTINGHTTLRHELDFVKEYLDIEEYRSGGGLDWAVKIDPDIDQGILVPNLIIHQFVEDAVDSGRLQPGGQGHIDISVNHTSIGILIMIVDNGKRNGHPIRGKNREQELKVLENNIKRFNEKQDHKVSYTILDHGNNDEDCPGTRVLITIRD